MRAEGVEKLSGRARPTFRILARSSRRMSTPTKPQPPPNTGAARSSGAGDWFERRARAALDSLSGADPGRGVRQLGRALLHAAFVGVLAGFAGALLVAALDLTQHFLLEVAAGYSPLRAAGEADIGWGAIGTFRPWVLVLVPTLGGLACGWITRWAPETRGGGADAALRAYHEQGGRVPRRVLFVKALASIATLGSGGSGGREGPTMQIGASIGSLVGDVLRVDARERRLLLVAGVAAGISAVFRTPLGAALLAVEVLYRDDFEAEAVVPALLSSVMAYAVAVVLVGQTRLFAVAPSYAFVPAHLPLFVLLALCITPAARAFHALIDAVGGVSRKLPLPEWTRPALGGLVLGLFALPLVHYVGVRAGHPGQGLGILGGGYGVAQLAILGGDALPMSWVAVELLLLLCVAKIVATSLTIGSGGSAGDFAPSLVIGGLLGGAFGYAARLVFHDPRIDPGAFALVGMGTFYGGIAHVPLSSLILVSELAGSYDLLVPSMLAAGVAFFTLRHTSLYHAQPVDRSGLRSRAAPKEAERAAALSVRELLPAGLGFVTLRAASSAAEALRAADGAVAQDVFPVLDDRGTLVGVATSSALRLTAGRNELHALVTVEDLMQAPVSVRADDRLDAATARMSSSELNELPVIDEHGAIVGLLRETDVLRAWLATRSEHA